MLSVWFKKLKPRRIGQQIGYGYCLALVIGGAGSIMGLIVADYFQGRGIFQLLDAQIQSQLLDDFDRSASQVRLQGAHAAALADDPAKQQEKLASLRVQLATVAIKRQELDIFLSTDPVWVADEPENLRALLAAYDRQLNEQVDAIFEVVQSNNASGLPALLSGQTADLLDQLHTNLAALIEISHQQEISAANTLEIAQGVEKTIIVISMLVSVITAGLLAWRTTVEIATPLENIAQVAQQVADDSNYQLRATVMGNDEMGLLAQSINYLIERVDADTQALAQAALRAEAQSEDLQKTLTTLRKTQAQLVHAEKMSSLGQLVAGIAHEINNPVGFIKGNLVHVQDYSETLFAIIDRLQTDLGDHSEDLDHYLEGEDLDFIRSDFANVIQSLHNGSHRIDSLVRSLNVFTRAQESRLKLTNLNEGLESTLLLLGHRLKPQAKRPEVEIVRCYSDLPRVDCYGGQINQVFMNILSNAVDAIDERWSQTTVDWQPEILIRTMQRDDAICIEIQNNGLAIPNPIQSKIFDPFFTTKPVGHGVGLGMSVSYEIMTQQHQGQIVCTSPIQDELGTRFTLALPLTFAEQPQVTSVAFQA